MNEILVINKEKSMTSRDVVNEVCKIFNTKKVGHTGTLDPIAEGVLVVCIGKLTKLVDIITSTEKEYIAEVKLGILTDTLDITGNILKEEYSVIKKEKLIKVLNSFIGEYMQEVPIYSAVKINGKKLYEYARENKDVILPKRKVKIKEIELLEFNNDSYKFKVLVSKGTYIRSLIKDINDKLGVIGTMKSLVRTRQGYFKIEDSYKLEDIKNGNYKALTINDIALTKKSVIIDEKLYKVIKNGGIIDNIYEDDLVTFIYKDNVIAIYKTYEKDNTKMKPYKMFI